MELRVLRYFLAVAEEGGFSRAAERLHVSQPALSQQIAQLEDEIGGRLFVRAARRIEPTDKALLLLRRAREILDLAERTQGELKATAAEELSGTIVVGAGETPAFGFIAQAFAELRRKHPGLSLQVISGNGEDISERLRAGSIDLGLFIGPSRYEGFDFLGLPFIHKWGLALRADDPLARKKSVSPKDLLGIPLIGSRQHAAQNLFTGWLGHPCSRLSLAATYNLIFNACEFVRAGLGAVICIDQLISEKPGDVVFRPFSPVLKSDVYLAWKNGVPPIPAARALIDRIRAQSGRNG